MIDVFDNAPEKEEDDRDYFPSYDEYVKKYDNYLKESNGGRTDIWKAAERGEDVSHMVGNLPPIVTPEEEATIKKMYAEHPQLRQKLKQNDSSVNFYMKPGVSDPFYPKDAWIQTYSGRRFNPTNPHVNAIVIQDIAHALSMQCRFSGHCKKFYSVAQHSVLVSFICDNNDALWGLLHDASEAYLVDIPRPLKQSGYFDAYKNMEANMMLAICERFKLPSKEPFSVKKADTLLLATEARDLMSPLRSDWVQPAEPLPFKIEAWGPQEAKNNFMKRFFDLTGSPHAYQHYLSYEEKV